MGVEGGWRWSGEVHDTRLTAHAYSRRGLAPHSEMCEGQGKMVGR